MRATWRNVKRSWNWKKFGTEVAIGAATGGLGKLAKAGKLAKYASKARGGARAARCRVLTRGSKVANKLSRGKIPAKAFCFTAGTPVLVKGGTLPIERVAVGEMVLSRDAVTGEQALKRVTETFVNTTTELVHLKMGDETISTTPKHPFWVEGSGWVDAGEVSAGDKLVLADGERATIVSVTRERLQSPLDVYNFEVEDFHTYFVASAGVWVHNACSVKVKGTSRGQHAYHANKELYRRVTESSRYAKRMRKKYGADVIDDFIAKKGRRNPRGLKWHHDGFSTKRDNYMRLLDDAGHRRWHGKHGPIGGYKQGQKAGRYR